MRSYSYLLREHLAGGLRSEELGRGVKHGLVQAFGLRAAKHGLVAADRLNAEITTAEWPFPQLFRGQSETLLLGDNSIDIVDESDWSSVAALTYDPLQTDLTLKAITAGGRWHFADFGKSWALFNGACTVFKTNREAMAGGTNHIFVQDDITIKSGCAFGGRAFIGGLANDFWTAEWQTFFSELAGSQVDPQISAVFEAGLNFVAWSSIGGGDLVTKLLFTIGMDSHIADMGYSDSNPYITEFLRANMFGFAPLPTQDAVVAILPLSNKAVLAYTANAVFAMIPVREPAVTIGFQRIASVGAVSRGAVAASDRSHVFVDGKGSLWHIGENLLAQRLGYQEFFFGMDSDNLALSSINAFGHEDFIISDGERAFVLSENGLTETAQLPTSIVVPDIAVCTSEEPDNDFTIETAIFDMDTPGLKTVRQVAIMGVGLSHVEVTVKTRFEEEGDFESSPVVETNPFGVATLTVSGEAFKVLITGAIAEGGRVDSIMIEWQLDDRRFRRSGYDIPVGTSGSE